MLVGKLAPGCCRAVLETADAGPQRTRPVKPAVCVERNPIRIDLRALQDHLAAGAVDREQSSRRAEVEAVVELGARVGEPESPVRPKGEVIRADERPAVDLG